MAVDAGAGAGAGFTASAFVVVVATAAAVIFLVLTPPRPVALTLAMALRPAAGPCLSRLLIVFSFSGTRGSFFVAVHQRPIYFYKSALTPHLHPHLRLRLGPSRL